MRAIRYLAKWFEIGSAICILAGTASGLLLVSLEWATAWRESHLWVIWLLPLGGLLSGLMSHYRSQRVGLSKYTALKHEQGRSIAALVHTNTTENHRLTNPLEDI